MTSRVTLQRNELAKDCRGTKPTGLRAELKVSRIVQVRLRLNDRPWPAWLQFGPRHLFACSGIVDMQVRLVSVKLR